MIHKFLIAALATAASVPLLAQATQVAPPVPVVRVAPVSPMRAMMADRVMTRAEVQAMVQTHFTRMDANRDGFIAGTELQAGHGGMKMGEHGGMGGHAMGDQPMRDPTAAFNRIDTNKDGMISRDEFAKGRELRIEQRVVMNGEGGKAMGDMRGNHGMRGMGMGRMMGGGMIKTADVNKDGRVSLQEATGTALQHFDRADTNRDGKLTPDEMRAAHQMMMQMHKAG